MGGWTQSAEATSDDVLIIPEGEPLPPDFAREPGEKAWRDLRLVRAGVPQHGSLVWLPEARQEWERREAEKWARIDEGIRKLRRR
jgi:hypothetical protein